MEHPEYLTRKEALAYIAGFFDGEGGITIGKRHTDYGRRRAFHLRLYVGNTNKEIIEFIRGFFERGSVYFDNSHHPQTCRPMYRWTVACKECEQVLGLLLPYLKIKGEQALLAIKFQSARHDPVAHVGHKGLVGLTEGEYAFQEECYEKMRELNRRGVARNVKRA